MKGDILPDHIPVNKYRVRVQGLPYLTFTNVSSLEEELETVDLPDRTVASGGNTKPIEFTAKLPAHHGIEVSAMEDWFLDSQDPVSPDYKKTTTLDSVSISGFNSRSYMLVGMFPCKRAIAEKIMNDEGALDEMEWTFKLDRIIPLN